jgi:hypothetical protein
MDRELRLFVGVPTGYTRGTRLPLSLPAYSKLHESRGVHASMCLYAVYAVSSLSLCTHYALANPRYGRGRQIELYSTVVDWKDGSYIFVRNYIVHE